MNKEMLDEMIKLLVRWKDEKSEERTKLRFCLEHKFEVQADYHRKRMELMSEFVDEYEDLVAKAQKL